MSSTKGAEEAETVEHGSHKPVGEHRSESGREGNVVSVVLWRLKKDTEPIVDGAVVPSGERV